jgi:Cu-Zn family superoxide dismutase
MHRVDTAGVAESIGTVTITVAGGRLVFTPALEGLQPGLHGFHVHEKPSCEPATDPEKGKVMPAQAAGPHLDPHKTGRHDGPMGDGHLGDLPALKVDNDGKATVPVVAPRLKMADLKGRPDSWGATLLTSPRSLGRRGTHRMWRDRILTKLPSPNVGAAAPAGSDCGSPATDSASRHSLR